jgi:hypothetical protein
MSSLAIVRDTSWVTPADEEYLQLIERERDLIEILFEGGASLRILLTWNLMEMLEWQERTREDVFRRLGRLRSFCVETLSDDKKIERARLVHLGVRERNLLILADACMFEGRKLSTKPGFEATQVITNKKRVVQEIEMFDILLDSAIENEGLTPRPAEPIELNRQLLISLVARIERDMMDLERLRSFAKTAV